MDRGLLVPDELVIDMVGARLEGADCKGGYILDGFPRTVAQSVALDEFLEKRGSSIDKVVVLTVPDGLIIERIIGRRTCAGCGSGFHIEFKPPVTEGRCDGCGSELSQRIDDTEEKVRVRLNEYAQNTTPVAAYYKQRGVVREINGVGGMDEVYGRLTEALES
jgi:adenylate kinase